MKLTLLNISEQLNSVKKGIAFDLLFCSNLYELK